MDVITISAKEWLSIAGNGKQVDAKVIISPCETYRDVISPVGRFLRRVAGLEIFTWRNTPIDLNNGVYQRTLSLFGLVVFKQSSKAKVYSAYSLRLGSFTAIRNDHNTRRGFEFYTNQIISPIESYKISTDDGHYTVTKFDEIELQDLYKTYPSLKGFDLTLYSYEYTEINRYKWLPSWWGKLFASRYNVLAARINGAFYEAKLNCIREVMENADKNWNRVIVTQVYYFRELSERFANINCRF